MNNWFKNAIAIFLSILSCQDFKGISKKSQLEKDLYTETTNMNIFEKINDSNDIKKINHHLIQKKIVSFSMMTSVHKGYMN